MVNLHDLYLSNNLITKIEGLDNLVNLKKLDLSYNQITKIEGINRLVYMCRLYIYNNKITEMNDPSEITSCINLIKLYYDQNIIMHPIIARFLNRKKLKK